MGQNLVGIHDMWRTMVYDYQINFATACQIIMYLKEDWTQDEIEAALPKEEAWKYAKYTFNNRIEINQEAM